MRSTATRISGVEKREGRRNNKRKWVFLINAIIAAIM